MLNFKTKDTHRDKFFQRGQITRKLFSIVLNVSLHNNLSSKYVKQKVTELQEEVTIIIVRVFFITSLLRTKGKADQNLCDVIKDLNKMINKFDLLNLIY